MFFGMYQKIALNISTCDYIIRLVKSFVFNVENEICKNILARCFKKHIYQNFKYINCGSIYNISVWDALKKEIINVMSSCMIIIQIRPRSYNKLIVSNKGYYLNVI